MAMRTGSPPVSTNAAADAAALAIKPRTFSSGAALTVFLGTSLVLFLVDSTNPPGVADGIGYPPVLALTLWIDGRGTVLRAALFLTVLIVIAQFIMPSGGVGIGYALFNRVIAIASLWAMAAILVRRKRLERLLLEAAAVSRTNVNAKDSFFATVSHELRTPLNAIIGFYEALNAGVYGQTDARAKQALDAIGTSAQHLLHLVNNMLDLTRINAGNLEAMIEPVDISIVVGEVLTMMRPSLDAAGLHAKVTLDPTMGLISGDQNLILQCLLNLLDNAIKFTGAGGCISVRSEAVARLGTRCVALLVSDTGVGIPATDLKRLLEPFQQGRVLTRRTPRTGAGLGLAITKSLMELQRGELRIDSVEGEGTTVRLVFLNAQTSSNLDMRSGADETVSK